MKNFIIKIILILAVVCAVGYPLWVHAINSDWAHTPLLVNLFPMFGLAAFTLLWLHVISGLFEPWLRQQFDFDAFIHWTSFTVLVLILLHPLALLWAINFSLPVVFGFGLLGVWLGIVGFILLLTYDLGKLLRKNDFFVQHWRRILIISTFGFVLIFFHSLLIGNDIQSGVLRLVWWFYGLTGIGAAVWLYWPRRQDHTLTIHE